MIGTPGLPYAWGFTYNGPYRYDVVKKRSDFACNSSNETRSLDDEIPQQPNL